MVVVGEAGAGKTLLCHRFLKGSNKFGGEMRFFCHILKEKRRVEEKNRAEDKDDGRR